MPSSDLRAFLFDFGGVFTDSPFEAVLEFGRAIGADPRAVSRIVFGSYEHDGEHPWHRLERGEIVLEQAREAIRALGRADGLDVDIHELFARMARGNAGAERRAPLVERVRRLREQGILTGMITNNVREFGQGWRSLIPVEELFGFVIDSSEVGVRKPDPRIFGHALARLGDVEPAQCVFLDDHPANVAAAQALGMRGILVDGDVAATMRGIDALLSDAR
jgi:epoxide hydrolase-like predicted phosphatase